MHHTNQLPLAVLQVVWTRVGKIAFDQCQLGAAQGPRAKLELALLDVKGKVGHVDATEAVEDRGTVPVVCAVRGEDNLSFVGCLSAAYSILYVPAAKGEEFVNLSVICGILAVRVNCLVEAEWQSLLWSNLDFSLPSSKITFSQPFKEWSMRVSSKIW